VTASGPDVQPQNRRELRELPDADDRAAQVRGRRDERFEALDFP